MSIRNTLIAGMLLALGACASDTSLKDNGTAATSSSYGSGSASGSSAGTGMTSPTDSTGASMAGTTGMAPAWTGTVVLIEPMTRQDAGIGVGAVGAAAAGGTLSQGAPTDRVYRVTMRMEDGTNQMVVVEGQPTYITGDRVRYSNGMLQKQ